MLLQPALSAEQTWTKCLSVIKENVADQTFGTWFVHTKGDSIEDHTLTVRIPNSFAYNWLEGHYRDLVHQAVMQVLGDNYRVMYSIIPPAEELQEPEAKPETVPRPPNEALSALNPHYTFQNFVEGGSNQFAKAAAQAVGEAPGKTSFNPLVV